MDEIERRTQQVRRFYRRRGESSPACVMCVCGMRAACGGPGGLPLDSTTHFHCRSNATRAPIANPPNSAQLGIPYHSPKLHPGPCNSVCMRPRTDTQTDTQTRLTTIHFSRSTTHAKCNKLRKCTRGTWWCQVRINDVCRARQMQLSHLTLTNVYVSDDDLSSINLNRRRMLTSHIQVTIDHQFASFFQVTKTFKNSSIIHNRTQHLK